MAIPSSLDSSVTPRAIWPASQSDIDDLQNHPHQNPGQKIIPSNDLQWKALIWELSSTISHHKSPHKPTATKFTAPQIAQAIDHTLLKLDTTEGQIDQLCAEAIKYGFKTVCVRLNWVKRAAEKLAGSGVGIACVVGFHEGTQSTENKVDEGRQAVQGGATELDMVMNYPLLKAGEYTNVFADVNAVRSANPPPTTLKFILETSQLTRDEIVASCVLACRAGFDFVKTSTGFNGPGASLENVRLMKAIAEKERATTREEVKVKASGGIRTAEDCVRMMEAGAERIGASAGVPIMEGLRSGEGVKEKGTEGNAVY